LLSDFDSLTWTEGIGGTQSAPQVQPVKITVQNY
jgi:hypothetical protein